MDIESALPRQGGPARGGWKALGLYAGVLSCVAVVAFLSGRWDPSRVACFAGGMPEIGRATAEQIAEEVRAAAADPSVKERLERVAEAMAAGPDFREQMERAVAGMQAELLNEDVQRRLDGLAARISESLGAPGAGGEPGGPGASPHHLTRFAGAGAVLPASPGRSAGAAAGLQRAGGAAGPRMQAQGAEGMAGATLPLGFWDPLGYSKSASEGRVRYFREAELKHGRVAMLAALGFIVGERVPFFFDGAFQGPAMKTWTQIGTAGFFWPGFFIGIAIPEVLSLSRYGKESGGKTLKDGKEPGDYGFDPLGLKPEEPGLLRAAQDRELNNGRLAMLGIAGMVAQELVTGQRIPILAGIDKVYYAVPISKMR